MDELIPIVGMVLTLGPLAIVVVSFTPIGRAITARIRGHSADFDRKLADMKEELRHELLDQQTAQIEDLHERLDFTERLLTGDRHANTSPPPALTPV